MQKLENLGTEFKCAAFPITGVMLHLEIQRGKEEMKKLPYHKELGATAACTVRLAQGITTCTSSDTSSTPRGIILADLWFGSVRASLALLEAGFESILQIKQNHGLFPKKQIEEVLKDAPGGSSIVL